MERIICATWNVKSSSESLEERVQFICDSVKSESPQIIAFQEVTQPIYDIIKRQDWYCDYRDVGSSTDGLHGNGKPFWNVLLVSKSLKPHLMANLYFKTKGHALYCAFSYHDKVVLFVTTHLSAMPGQHHLRLSQFREIHAIVKAVGDCAVVLGDFNLIGDDELPFQDYTDVWTACRPKYDPGFTLDSYLNENVKYQERLDRIFVHGSLVPFSIDLLGTRPIRRRFRQPPLFASDHFGLTAHLQV